MSSAPSRIRKTSALSVRLGGPFYFAAAPTGVPHCCSNSFNFFSRNGRLATAAQLAWWVTASFCTCAQRASESPLFQGCLVSGRCLGHQIIERTMIILQIEDAIALLEIEIRSVQLIAMAQAGGKVSPHQLCLPDLCLDVIERFGILRAQRSHSYQDKRNSQQTCPHHFRLRRESPNGDEFYTIR